MSRDILGAGLAQARRRLAAAWAFTLGDAWMALHRPRRAAGHYRRVLHLGNGDARAAAALGFALASAGDRRGAIAAFDTALALRPAWADVHFDRGFLLQALGDHASAITAFDAALALRPEHDRACYGRALSLLACGRRDEAVAPLERTTRLQPFSPDGWYQLALVQFARGKPEKARAIIGHLATFEPGVAAQLARETGLPAPD